MIGVRRYPGMGALHLFHHHTEHTYLRVSTLGTLVVVAPLVYPFQSEVRLADADLRLLLRGVLAGTTPPEPLLDCLRDVWPEGWGVMDRIFGGDA